MSRPTIGIAGTLRTLHLPFADIPAHTVFAGYVGPVAASGGIPVLLPAEPGLAEDLLAAVDGLVLTGGPDLDPATYGGIRTAATQPGDPRRDRFELALVAAAGARGTPVLGVCRGLHLVNVALGGTLLPHVDGHAEWGLRHPVAVRPGSRLAEVIGTAVETGSLHHQAVDRLGRGVRAVGLAPDGTVEAIETASGPPVLAVQWHPELEDTATSRALFSWLVDVAARPHQSGTMAV